MHDENHVVLTIRRVFGEVGDGKRQAGALSYFDRHGVHVTPADIHRMAPERGDEVAAVGADLQPTPVSVLRE
jgi:hypothetical protein